jgi:PAS domain S-box-containing protein
MASGEHGSHQPVRSTDPQQDGTLAKDLASEDILEILRMILADASLKEVLTSVARVVESHREGMLCSVWLLDQDRVRMRAIAAPTLPESYIAALDGFVVGPQGGSCGAAVNQRKPVFVSDVLTDPILEQVRDIIAAHGIRACWSAPIISHQGEILGTFAFYFRSVRSPSPRDIHLIENATSIAGIAIERKKAEENLRRSEWTLLEAQRLAHSGSWSVDVSSGIVTNSPEMHRAFDVKPGDDCSRSDFWFNRIHPEDRKRVRDLFERCVMEKTDYEADYRLLLPDGTIKYQHSIGRPIVNEKGDLVEFVGTAIDVTEQAQARIELEKAFEEIKQRTEAARRSEREFRDVVNTVPAHVWSTSPEGQVDFVNDRWLQFTGLTLDGASGWKWEAVLHPDDRTRVVADWHTAVKNGQATESEARVRRADGEYCWWFIRNVPLRDETGKIVRWYGTAIDIEDRKRVEQALRRSEAYLAEAHRLAKTGSWAYSPAAEKCIYWSDEMRRIFGLDPQRSNLPDREEFLRLVHPEDRDRFNERIDEAFSEKADFVQDYRIVLTDGTVKHIHGIGHPVLDETGNIVEYVGTDADVTERKRDEEALQRSEGYLAEAQKLTRTGSWAAQVSQTESVSWSIVYWSEEMYRIFGFDPSPTPPSYVEAAGRFHSEEVPYLERVVKEAIRDRTDFEVDYRILLPNGAAKYIHAVGHPVVNASGDVIELVGTAMDVTEQHESRAALQAAFEKIQAEETELRRMTDAIASFIYVFRPDGTALYANQTVLDYTGLTLEEVQREDFPARIFHPEDVERLLDKRNEAVARGKPFELEKRELGKDGNYRWFLVRYNPLRDDQGHIIRWYATGTDIEDRKRAEERMRDETLALREEIDQAFMFEEIVGSSPALQTVLSSIVKVAPTDSTVLITGETGTGKELVARAIHKHSHRSGQAFISVNCASMPSSLIASELFGHEKGAFTGAVQRRQGRFEMAHSGTIFLDEVGELPAETQIALLRVLQERQFERVGGNRVIPTDVRVIAATNRDLTVAIAAGTFRADLFYRLNVFPIEVPPLRKRKEDIPMLVEYFVKRYAEKMGKQIRKIDNSTLERCQSYPWPGNIRELQNIVERSVILCGGDTFGIEKAWLASVQPPRQELAGPLPDTLQNQEREIIETALAESKGKIAGPEGAAAKLGIPRSTLDSKIKQLRIKKHKFVAER